MGIKQILLIILGIALTGCGGNADTVAPVLDSTEDSESRDEHSYLPPAIGALTQGPFDRYGFEFEPGRTRDCELRLDFPGQIRLWRCQVEGSYLLLTGQNGVQQRLSLDGDLEIRHTYPGRGERVYGYFFQSTVISEGPNDTPLRDQYNIWLIAKRSLPGKLGGHITHAGTGNVSEIQGRFVEEL